MAAPAFVPKLEALCHCRLRPHRASHWARSRHGPPAFRKGGHASAPQACAHSTLRRACTSESRGATLCARPQMTNNRMHGNTQNRDLPNAQVRKYSSSSNGSAPPRDDLHAKCCPGSSRRKCRGPIGLKSPRPIENSWRDEPRHGCVLRWDGRAEIRIEPVPRKRTAQGRPAFAAPAL